MSRIQCTCVVLLAATVMNIHSNPIIENDVLDKAIKERANLQLLEQIFVRLENMVGNNLGNLFNKINSLTLVSDHLLQLTRGRDVNISQGTREDMAKRCPQGFRAVAGDSMCY